MKLSKKLPIAALLLTGALLRKQRKPCHPTVVVMA
jgi:hypothetical protein